MSDTKVAVIFASCPVRQDTPLLPLCHLHQHQSTENIILCPMSIYNLIVVWCLFAHFLRPTHQKRFRTETQFLRWSSFYKEAVQRTRVRPTVFQLTKRLWHMGFFINIYVIIIIFEKEFHKKASQLLKHWIGNVRSTFIWDFARFIKPQKPLPWNFTQ